MSAMLYATHARVDLDAIGDNLAGIRAAVGPDRAILMAVKANAYGHGAVPVSKAATRPGLADWLGVATVPEGIELREAGLTVPILKLSHCFPDELDAAVAADLTLALVDVDGADAAQAVASRRECRDPVAVHLKVDTGMGRIGVATDGAAALAAHVESFCPRLRLDGIFTHLPASDSPAQDDFTSAQIGRFHDTTAAVEAEIGRPVRYVHAANSGGVLAHPSSWGTMVRPGIMTYGYYPDPATPRTIPLRPAVSWHTRVSFLKRVEPGTTVGYGRTWSPTEPTWVATMPVGYADGFDRHLSNRGTVLVGGAAYPVVGRVCMDQAMFAVGPEPVVAVGDDVVLLGQSGSVSYTAADMAGDLGTISYEVTCSLAPRVTRTYVGG